MLLSLQAQYGALPAGSDQGKEQMPDVVAILKASDHFLKERVINMPEAEFAANFGVGPDGVPEGLDPRLELYHAPPADADAKKKKDA